MGRRDRYADRTEAGSVLAEAVVGVIGDEPAVVLALPRGGLPVAVPVAERLGAPLGLMLVRKLGVPGRPELAMGALAGSSTAVELVRNDEVIEQVRVDPATFERVRRGEEAELRDRADRYGDVPVEAGGRTVVLVDDGLATGMTALAAVAAARAQHAERVIMAAPVGSLPAVALLARAADRVVCPLVPADFVAVSIFYRRFDQLTDREVTEILATRSR